MNRSAESTRHSPRRLAWRWLLAAALAGAIALGYHYTAPNPAGSTATNSGLAPATMAQLRRDQRLYQQARTLAEAATTPSERALGMQALVAADAVLDQSFTIAINQVQAAGAAQTVAPSALSQRADQIAAEVAADQQQIAVQQRAPDKPDAAAALDLARAQLGLDQARLKDATADAARSGPDGSDRVLQMEQQHEAMHAADKTAAANGSAGAVARGLIGALAQSWQLTQTIAGLNAAQAAAQQAGAQILAAHDQLHAQFTAAEHAAMNGPAPPRVATLHTLEQEQEQVSRFDAQADAATALADTYAQWAPLAATRRVRALHQALQQALWLLGILVGLLLLLQAWARLMAHPRWDRQRATTLRHLLNLCTTVTAALAALVALFGRPPQLLTVLGLCGAGLTVAFQDAILSLAGWFVLMGRHGVRLGDWVEINGVVGEVIEIHLLRTVMMETGNWITAGHPTGRRVFFPNNFALKGSYFNYTTNGQWLWDELQVALPAGTEPAAALERVSEALQRELQPQSERAHSEWQYLHGPVGFTTAPSVHLRPEGSSNALVVRYTTPAQERSATRERLWLVIAAALQRALAAGG